MKNAKRVRLGLLLLVVPAMLLALAGCGAGAGQQASASDVVQKVRDTMKSATSVQGTIQLSAKINKDGIKALVGQYMPGALNRNGKDALAMLPDLASATVSVWKERSGKERIEVGDSTLPGVKGAVLVYDGARIYAYAPIVKKVYSVSVSELRSIAQQHAQQQSPLPMLDSWKGLTPDQVVDKLLDAADVQLVGTEKVSGIDSYKLEVTAKPDALELLGVPAMMQLQAGQIIKAAKVTVWVDEARWVPLQVMVEQPSIGQLTYTATSLTLDKPIDQAEFVLQTPAGAKVVDLDPVLKSRITNTAPQSMTLPEARTAASGEGWKLLEPTYLLSGATLVSLKARTVQGGKFYVLTYSSAQADVNIAEGKVKPQAELGDQYSGVNDASGAASKEVTVHGVKATAFSPAGGKWTSITWQEPSSGIWVTIRGGLSLDEVVKIAEGMK